MFGSLGHKGREKRAPGLFISGFYSRYSIYLALSYCRIVIKGVSQRPNVHHVNNGKQLLFPLAEKLFILMLRLNCNDVY